jgi:hypothetical protein
VKKKPEPAITPCALHGHDYNQIAAPARLGWDQTAIPQQTATLLCRKCGDVKRVTL